MLLLVSCGAPTGQGASISEQIANISRELEIKYEKEYQSMVRMNADNIKICVHISIAIITPLKEGWVPEVKKWGKRQIDLDCWNRTYKTYSDLPK